MGAKASESWTWSRTHAPHPHTFHSSSFCRYLNGHKAPEPLISTRRAGAQPAGDFHSPLPTRRTRKDIPHTPNLKPAAKRGSGILTAVLISARGILNRKTAIYTLYRTCPITSQRRSNHTGAGKGNYQHCASILVLSVAGAAEFLTPQNREEKPPGNPSSHRLVHENKGNRACKSALHQSVLHFFGGALGERKRTGKGELLQRKFKISERRPREVNSESAPEKQVRGTGAPEHHAAALTLRDTAAGTHSLRKQEVLPGP